MHKRISKATLHLLWYALVTTIVISTLLVSLIWLTSSSIDDLRPKILEWVNTTTGQHVEVNNLEIEWKGIIPHLKLSDISVLDRITKKRLTHVDQARMSVDLYHSLLDWKVSIGHLELTGINIDLVHQKDGTITLPGLTEQKGSSDKLTGWLLKQPHLKIIDSQFSWHEQTLQIKPIILTDVDIEFTNKHSINKDPLHLLSAYTRLADNKGGLNFQLEINGDPLSTDWNGNLILETQEFDFTSYLPVNINEELGSVLKTDSVSLHNARLNSTIQFNWKNDQLMDLNGKFSLKNPAPIYSISGLFSVIKNTVNNWQIDFPQLSVAALNHNWQPFSLQLQIPSSFSKQEPEFDAIVVNTRIEDLITVLPESYQEQLNQFQPGGRLNNFRIYYNQQNSQTPLLIDGEFSDLSLLASEKMPIMENLAGHFRTGKNRIEIDLNTRNLMMTSSTGEEKQAPSVIRFSRLNGRLEWEKLDQAWQLSIPQLSLTDPNLEFQLTGSVKREYTESPMLDLQGTFFRGNIGPIINMIPANLLHPHTIEWFDQANITGNLTGGNLIVHGHLDEFPFENQQGLFELRLNAEQGSLNYFKGWPEIEQITAEVLFKGRKMLITSPHAKIFAADVENTRVEIPDLLAVKHHLLIDGNAYGTMEDGLHFINNSPLKATVGKKINNLKLKGDLDLDLTLDIPLAKGSKTKVDGIVHLNNNSLALDTPKIEIKAITGDFLFNRNQWQGKDLKARLFESAIGIYLNIDDRKESVKSDVKLTGLADKNYITNRLIQLGMKRDQLKILESISGTTTWQAQLSLPSEIGSPGEDTRLLIESNLKGLKINAPSPLGKPGAKDHMLKISTTLSDKPDRQINFDYSDIVKGDIKIGARENSTYLKNLLIHFGKGKLPVSNNNFVITATGDIAQLDIPAWSDFLDQYSVNKDIANLPSKNLFLFDLRIKELDIAGQRFKQNKIQGQSNTQSWTLKIENKGTLGTLNLPYDFRNQPVRAEFERLTIAPRENKKQGSELEPKDIPEVNLTSDQFHYNDLHLGSLELHTIPENGGVHVETLKLTTPQVNVDVNGNWTKLKNQQHSVFKISAHGQALGPMLEKFGFGVSGIEGGQTNMTIDASWSGSPADFELARIKGNLRLDVGGGRFTEVKNRVGKIFGLLSLQSLGRRLSLDFNDLFKKGFTFDDITGDFDIDGGNAYTNNLGMTGPSANIDVTGRIGLSDQDYDQVITVTPSVADSLPVASALFGPVGAGVGAALLLAEKVIPKLPDTIDKVLERQYTLTGTWDQPLVEQITRQNSQQAKGYPVN